MFWNKKQKKSGTAKDRNLFREAFLPPKKVAPKQPPKRLLSWKCSGVVALWMFFSVTVVYIVFASSFHSIETVSVVGTTDIPNDRIEAFFRDRMQGEYAFIFPKDNFFLIRSEDAERAVLESFPKLRSVEIRKRFPNRMEVAVAERDRIPLWCSSGACFLLDDDGVARDARFARQPENEPFLFHIEDSGTRGVVSGEPVLDGDTLSRILGLEQGIRTSGAVSIVSHVVTPSRVSGEFRFTTTEGFDILTSTEPDPETTVAALRLVLEKEIPEERRAKLRYIDLRTEKKAFYSFIPEEPVLVEVPKNPDSDSESKKLKDEKKK